MKKKTTKGQPRFVVYATEDEVAQATRKAHLSGHRTHHKWAGVIIRKELAK